VNSKLPTAYYPLSVRGFGMFIEFSTLLIVVVFAFMLGMLTSFIMVINALMRFKK
jgi:hypothetical protein